MVGTNATRFWPRNWSRNAWMEEMTFMNVVCGRGRSVPVRGIGFAGLS